MIGSENMLNDQINSINNMIEKVSMFKSCLEHYNEDSIHNADYEFQRIYENFNEIVKHMCETLSKVISYEYDMLTYIDRELPDSFIKDNNNMYTDLMNRIIVVHNYINQLFSEFMTVSDFHKLKTELNYNSYPALIADTDGNTVIVNLPYLPKKKVIFNDRIENDLMVNLLDNLMLSKEIPQMKEKIIRVVNIFSSATRIHSIPDNDKYNLRNVIDNISDYTAGTDNGIRCKIIIESFITDELYEGSYIIAEPCLPEQTLDRSSIDIIKSYQVFTKI